MDGHSIPSFSAEHQALGSSILARVNRVGLSGRLCDSHRRNLAK